MTERVDDHLPLAPAVFHVLLALADGEKHGYAMMGKSAPGRVARSP